MPLLHVYLYFYSGLALLCPRGVDGSATARQLQEALENTQSKRNLSHAAHKASCCLECTCTVRLVAFLLQLQAAARAGTRFAQVRARTEFAGEHRRPGVAGRAARSCMMVERTPRYIRPGPATLKSPGRDTAPGRLKEHGNPAAMPLYNCVKRMLAL